MNDRNLSQKSWLSDKQTRFFRIVLAWYSCITGETTRNNNHYLRQGKKKTSSNLLIKCGVLDKTMLLQLRQQMRAQPSISFRQIEAFSESEDPRLHYVPNTSMLFMTLFTLVPPLECHSGHRTWNYSRNRCHNSLSRQLNSSDYMSLFYGAKAWILLRPNAAGLQVFKEKFLPKIFNTVRISVDSCIRTHKEMYDLLNDMSVVQRIKIQRLLVLVTTFEWKTILKDTGFWCGN